MGAGNGDLRTPYGWPISSRRYGRDVGQRCKGGSKVIRISRTRITKSYGRIGQRGNHRRESAAYQTPETDDLLPRGEVADVSRRRKQYEQPIPQLIHIDRQFPLGVRIIGNLHKEGSIVALPEVAMDGQAPRGGGDFQHRRACQGHVSRDGA